MNGHILRVSMREYHRENEEIRWCFKCRKRTLHELVFKTPVDQMSYYGPDASIECPICHEDNADFPGIYRDGPRYDFE